MHLINRKNRPIPIASLLLLMLMLCGCPRPAEENAAGEEQAAVESTEEQVESIDWSTVTPEEFWSMVGDSYETEGPRQALTLLDEGISMGTVTQLEADQSRAAFLYELGQYDDAFIALVRYRIDESRPDLLRLRAEILWRMGRYDEAQRDYETLYGSLEEPETEILVALSYLYDDLGEWEKSEDIRTILRTRMTDDPSAAQWAIYDSIRSMEERRIRDALNNWTILRATEEPDPAEIVGSMYILYLQGDIEGAIGTGRASVEEGEFTLNTVTALLNFDVEASDFEGFESDLRTALARLDAADWLDPSGGSWSSPPDNRALVATLLSSGSALELGKGNRELARILAERAKLMNPYEYSAILQAAAVQMTAGDIAGCFESMNEALQIAPPTDIRTRSRLLQFSRLASDDVETPWDNGTIASELESAAEPRIERYPENPYYRAALAEVEGYRGTLDEALRILLEAGDLPSASREIRIRTAYYLARLGRTDDAWDLIEANVQPGTPLLLWPSLYEQEAEIRSDESLALFATMLRNHLDPLGDHRSFFVRESGN
jgi:tetratricopeptide (TPR) repeat protein